MELQIFLLRDNMRSRIRNNVPCSTMFKHSAKLGHFKVPFSGYTPGSNTLKVIPAVLNHSSVASEENFSVSRIYVSMKSIIKGTIQ